MPEPALSASLAPPVALSLSAREGETLDSICAGDLQLLQRVDGYRFNLDPILLAHFAAQQVRAPEGQLIDLGTGCGIIPIVLARKLGLRRLNGLEVQPALYELAQRNVQLNHCEQEISLTLGDLRHVPESYSPGRYTHVVANPPFRAPDAGLLNPSLEKAIARHELRCSIRDVAQAAAHLLREGGALSVVFPSSRLADLLEAVRAAKLQPKLLRLVHPREGQGANRVLLCAFKGGRAELQVLPPLVVHDPQGFSAEVREMVG